MLIPGQEPGGREPAPGRLRVVQSFVNTINLEAPEDWIETPEQLAAFLRGQRLIGDDDPVRDEDLSRAVELREALRRLLLENNGEPHDEAASAVVAHAARAAQLGVSVSPRGAAELVPGASGVDGALGTVVAICTESMLDGSWQRLKACRRDVCHWAFYDHSRNRSGAWCSMSICGNRTKTRVYRRRRQS